MRLSLFFLILVPGLASAQLTDAEKKATLTYIRTHYDVATGAYRVDGKSPPGLRATLGAIRAIDHIGGERIDSAKSSSFIISCYDSTSGGFREPLGHPNATITGVGIMAAVEFNIDQARFPKALDYLNSNAKTFEEVRIGAAAVEALQKKPDWLSTWIRLAEDQLNNNGTAGKGDSLARDTASVAAMKLRLGYPIANKSKVIEAIVNGQRDDGGWGKGIAKSSDLESTYRVMRSLMLLKEKPKDTKKLNSFLSKCRNSDGGYGIEPEQPSSMSAVYYAAAVSKWMEK